MYIVYPTKEYQKMLKKMSSQRSFDEDALNIVIDLLVSGDTLPKRYQDHKLKGEFHLCRELHIKNDMLLMYFKDESELILVLLAVGTHNNLFSK